MFEVGYLLDTNIVVKLAAARSGSTDPQDVCVLEKAESVQDKAQLFICAAVVGEIEYGLQAAPSKDPTKQAQMRAICRAFPVVFAHDENVARGCYATLRAKLFQTFAPKDKKNRAKSRHVEEWIDPTTGKALGVTENDVWIAAVALCHNLVLVTNDRMANIVKVAGGALQIEDWTICDSEWT